MNKAQELFEKMFTRYSDDGKTAFPLNENVVTREQVEELLEAAHEYLKQDLAAQNEYLQKREDHFIKELAHMRETQPGRGKPIVRIKKDGNWYIPQITTYLNSPDGIIVEGEI